MDACFLCDVIQVIRDRHVCKVAYFRPLLFPLGLDICVQNSYANNKTDEDSYDSGKYVDSKSFRVQPEADKG